MGEEMRSENIRGEELVEQVGDWRGKDLTIDAAQRMVRNVALSGATSRNGHRYTEESLREGAGLYVRKPVFLDHAPSGSRPQERSTRDLVGTITGARYEGGRIRGDIQVLETGAGETFLKLVESNAPQVGMSHVVIVERGRDPKVVEAIRDVISVDAVVFPATTSTFQESVRQGEEEGRNLEEELRGVRLELAALVEERERWGRRKGEEERERERREEVERMLREARLPAGVVTEEFRALLLDEGLQEFRLRLIAERRALGRKWESERPRSAERKERGGRMDDKWVVRVIKGELRAA